MKFLKVTIFASLILLIYGCKLTSIEIESNSTSSEEKKKQLLKKIPILNFGTFHFGYTNDENTTKFDEHDKENQKQAHLIAEKLSSFKPTVILVEFIPEYNEKLQKAYKNYLINPKIAFENPTEVELPAVVLGRICGLKRIYGSDHKMGYNYNIGNEIINSIDSIWHNRFYKNSFSFYPDLNKNIDSLNLFQKLLLFNQDQFLDFVITVNADMLTHVGTKQGFEVADEAAKYYQRNLRMYSNLNRLDLNEDDRVFILMGASHTAFFRDFISRSPKYEMVNTFEYLK